MGRASTLRKLRQYSRRETAKHFEKIEYEACLKMMLKPKPRWIPEFIYMALARLLIYPNATKEKEKTIQAENDNSQGGKED